MSTYTITDTITGRTATCEVYDIADTIRPWYSQAPQEVLDAIEELQALARRGEYTGELEAYLAVTIR